MALTSIRLQDFRCYTSLRCALAPGMTLFVGDNAQGKTSLLEAVCVLLRLQSPRCQGTAELVKFGAAEFGVAGTFDGRELRHRGGHVRELAVDGCVVRKPGDYLPASGLVVWMGNGDMELVAGGSEVRRRYLDFLGTQVFAEYRTELRAYEKALRARNLLLKRDAVPPWREIEAWTPLLVAHGLALRRWREELVAGLTPFAAEAHMAAGGAGEVLGMAYEAGCGEDFAEEIGAARGEEARRRLTFLGPHRDDFGITINGLPAARYGSEGQQRTIALALKLAQAAVLRGRCGREPLLLIDDIFGELDPRRRNALLKALPEGAQKLVTTTHLDWMEAGARPEAIYLVKGGEVTLAGA